MLTTGQPNPAQANRSHAPAEKPDASALLKQAKADFLAVLARYGIDESDMIVTLPRLSRPRRFGHYRHMSQFRSRLGIVVDVRSIRDHFRSEVLAALEVRKTLAHEYAHAMAECIRELPSVSDGQQAFVLPDWKPRFKDEEAFAEDFAHYCFEHDADQEAFWDEFMPLYAAEMLRLFAANETPA